MKKKQGVRKKKWKKSTRSSYRGTRNESEGLEKRPKQWIKVEKVKQSNVGVEKEGKTRCAKEKKKKKHGGLVQREPNESEGLDNTLWRKKHLDCSGVLKVGSRLIRDEELPHSTTKTLSACPSTRWKLNPCEMLLDYSTRCLESCCGWESQQLHDSMFAFEKN